MLFALLFGFLLHNGNLLGGILPIVVHLSVSANLLYLCHVKFLLCHFSTIVHPDGMLFTPVVFGNVLGQVNVPDAATPLTQFPVLLVSHVVKLTSIDARLLHL